MIRRMHASDRDAVVGILHATNVFTPSEVALAIEQIDIYLSNSKQRDYNVVVLESEDFHVVGYISFGPAAIAEDVYNLYWIAVHPRAQGRGYGRELVQWLEKWVQSAFARMILVETSSLSTYKSTREFYRSMGFKEVSRVRDFYKLGDDRITYVKHIMKEEEECHGSGAETSKAEL
jgi:ribosomal protein S18 acetylase RimI-like enzyme